MSKRLLLRLVEEEARHCEHQCCIDGSGAMGKYRSSGYGLKTWSRRATFVVSNPACSCAMKGFRGDL